MNNVIILPIIIPLIAGIIMIIFRNNIRFHRLFSILAIVATGMISVFLINQIKTEGIQTLQLGGWQAPFGISLVADMFAGLLLLTTSVVAFAV